MGPDAIKAQKKNFAPTTAPLRRLSITAKSTKLARLDLLMRGLGYNTLVKDMEGYRAKGLAVDWLIQMTARDEDIEANSTRLNKLCFLAEGSPTLRYIIYQLRDYVLGADSSQQRKLLITEDIPLVAWFWEMVCRYLYIETEVLHSGLNNEARWNLVQSFNDVNSPLKVLVLMYNVGAQGVNLDQCCCRVLVATAAINASLEIQAWGRVIRVCILHSYRSETALYANAFRL